MLFGAGIAAQSTPVASTLGIVGLALASAIGLLLVASSDRGATLLRPVARLGRMTLTNYLAQSAIFGFVFYAYGLGQYGKWGSALAIVFGIGVYVIQVALSHVWFQYHPQGPMEALLRRLSYRPNAGR